MEQRSFYIFLTLTLTLLLLCSGCGEPKNQDLTSNTLTSLSGTYSKPGGTLVVTPDLELYVFSGCNYLGQFTEPDKASNKSILSLVSVSGFACNIEEKEYDCEISLFESEISIICEDFEFIYERATK